MLSTTVSDNLIIHTAVDTVKLDDITQTMQAWFQHPEFDAEKPVLWDLRLAMLDISIDSLGAWSEKMVEIVNQLRSGRKSAWVFPTAEAAEAAVEVLGSQNWASRVRIYQNDYEAAHAWLTSMIQ